MTVLTTNQAFIHLSVFELTPYPSLLDSWDPSAPLHLFTSYVSPHLSIHHSSTYLWPNTQFHQLHAALTATHPPFRSIICFFFYNSHACYFHPVPCFNLPPQSDCLNRKSSFSSHPGISRQLQSAESKIKEFFRFFSI